MATLTAAISSSQTEFSVTGDTSAASPGKEYRIDDEVITLREFVRTKATRRGPRNPNRWSVSRAQAGTSAASHLIGAEIVGTEEAVTTGETLAPPEPFAGEGGTPVEQVVYGLTVTLTAAQIAALPSARVEIVPPTETLNYSGVPTELFIPIHCQIVTRSLSNATNVDDSPEPTVLLVVGSDWSLSMMGVYHVDLLAATQLFLMGTYFTQMRMTGMDFEDIVSLASSIKDNGLYLAGTNGGNGNFTGVDSGTTWDVTVLYVTVDV